MTAKVASDLLEEKLEDLFSDQEVGDLEMSQTQKPTFDSTLLILDRSFDISAALMHDWSYMSFI